MGEKELILSIGLLNLFLFTFLVGIVLFIFQYRKKKKEYDSDVVQLNEKILETKLESQSQTMISIGNEIHDGVGQKLTLASLYLQKSSMKIDPMHLKDINEVNTLISESLHDLRLLSKTLVNPEVAQLKLIDLLKLDQKRISELNAIKVKVSEIGVPFEPNEIYKNDIYRIIQEFTQNSLKHASCKNIDIKLEYEYPSIKITCHDNGKGFDKKAKPTGIGLTNMKRRAFSIKSDLKIESEVGSGTTLFLNYKEQ